MSNDWYDDATIQKHIRDIAEKVIRDYQRELPEKIAGNKFRVPPLMREWMDSEAPNRGGVDNYYVTTVGYGYNALSCHFTFRENDITLEFRLPNGTRLFILELIKLCFPVLAAVPSGMRDCGFFYIDMYSMTQFLLN